MSTKLKVFLAAGLLAFAGFACNGDDGNGNGNGNGNGEPDAEADMGMPDTMPDTMPDMDCQVTSTFQLSGQASVHPTVQAMAAAGGGSPPALANIELRVLRAQEALATNYSTIRQTGICEDAVFTTASDFMNPATTFDFPDGVDASGVGIAVTGVIDDSGNFGSGDGTWVPTVSGFAAAESGMIANDVTDAQAFAVTASAEESWASVVGPEASNVSGDPGSLLGAGAAVVLFLDSSDPPQPVSGVKFYTQSEAESVTSGGSGSAYANAYYPNDDFSSVSVGENGETASHGTVIVTGTSPTTNYTGLVDEGGGTYTEFTTQQGGSVSGLFYTITLTEATGGS